jgi:DNA-binding NarL/FixJ family response regulator
VKKLVLIDDHEALRGGLEMMLNNSGFEVVGTAGQHGGRPRPGRPDAPGRRDRGHRHARGNGIDLTRQLLERHPTSPSSLHRRRDAELLYEGLDSGARGYVLKAGTMAELLGAIRQVANGGSYRRPPPLDRILLSPRATSRVPQLSPREREIMHLMAEGLTAEAIGTKITVSVETVRTHVRNVIRKLQARNRVHAIAIALERGEIALEHEQQRSGGHG